MKGEFGELSQLSIRFSIIIVEHYKWLAYERKEYVMSKQLLRSGTSIGANIHEGNYGSSRVDFINKLQIALKEAAETEYWLIILNNTGYYHTDLNEINDMLMSIKRLLIASIRTAKSKESKFNSDN